MRIAGATHPGRGHRERGIPCQDSYATWEDPAQDRAVAAVADGLGSCPLSDVGSRIAAQAAVDALADEPSWDEAAMARAFEAAQAAVHREAALRGAPLSDLHTTLQVAALQGDLLVAGMVGDGAIVGEAGGVRIVLAPAESAYANEVVPVTSSAWREALQMATLGEVRSALLFTDGLTRLLLSRSRQGWAPFTPFFDSFLPRLDGEPPQTLVATLVASPEVDGAWDDDKCLVVMGRGP